MTHAFNNVVVVVVVVAGKNAIGLIGTRRARPASPKRGARDLRSAIIVAYTRIVINYVITRALTADVKNDRDVRASLNNVRGIKKGERERERENKGTMRRNI